MLPDDLDFIAVPVGHLPLVVAVLNELGVLDVVDEHSPKDPRQRVSDASCVAAMVVNILSGRIALYAIEEWLKHTDTELLLGVGCEPGAFNDTRLATMLDRIDTVGTDVVMGDIVERYLVGDDRPTEYSVHTDTTSISLYGQYLAGTEPKVTHGFSKDHRPDLKQLIFSLTLHGAVGIPLLHAMKAGNTSDQVANRDVLAQLATMLPEDDDVTVVADCKLVDSDTVGRVLGGGLHLVSLVPDNFSLRGQLIDAAWAERPDVDDWPVLARSPGRRKDDPHKLYRGWSTEQPFDVLLRPEADPDADPVPSTETMRFLVVNSTTLSARYERSLPNKLAKEEKAVAAFSKRHSKGFACAEDAVAAVDKLRPKLSLHQLGVEVEQEVRELKRGRVGRPRKDEQPPTETVWTVKLECEPDEAAIERARRRNSCFVLITSHLFDEGDWSDERVLAEYRHQYLVEGHTGFRWLKSEAAVAPMFLKNPGRIRAMGLILIISLMVRNYIQFTMRAALQERGETLPHPFTKKEVDNLTTEMAMAWFAEVQARQITFAGSERRRLPVKLREPAARILELIGVSKVWFERPGGPSG